MTKQFNVELPIKKVNRVKTDCIKLNASLQDYTELAFDYLQTLPISELRKRLAPNRKTTGRKISVS